MGKKLTLRVENLECHSKKSVHFKHEIELHVWKWEVDLEYTKNKSNQSTLDNLGTNKELMCVAPVKMPLTSKSRRLSLHIFVAMIGGENLQNTTQITENWSHRRRPELIVGLESKS